MYIYILQNIYDRPPSPPLQFQMIFWLATYLQFSNKPNAHFNISCMSGLDMFNDNQPSPILWFLWHILVSVAMQVPTYSGPEIYTKEGSAGNTIIKTKHNDAIAFIIHDRAINIRYKMLPKTHIQPVVLLNSRLLFKKPILYPRMKVDNLIQNLLPKLTQTTKHTYLGGCVGLWKCVLLEYISN